MSSNAAREISPRLDKRAETRRRLELERGMPIEHIVTDAITRTGSCAGAARDLKVCPSTIHYWRREFGIGTKLVAYIGRPRVAS